MKNLNPCVALLFVAFLAVSCKNEDVIPVSVEQKELLVNGSPTGGNFTLYSFATGGIIANTDSATNKWDFGIRFEKIIVNSYASGPGNATAQIADGVFDNYNNAPEFNYAYDTTAAKLAIKGTAWYNYDPITRVFSPKAGKVFVFKTNANNYAKMEILTADPTDDNGNPVTPPTRPTKIKYKIRTAVQLDGSRVF